jgi:DNA-binding winged helix-turn-helix (wHTH) protein/energy-coupling factor transporter ATP-binding protein EcfA2
MAELSPFRLDPANQCLWRRTDTGGEERILLTPTEFGVLDHLVEHAGQLVTHRDLLDAVWPGAAIEPQAVKSKIFHLRRVLEDNPKRPRYIETLSRRGYRFVGTLERSTLCGSEPPTPGSRLVGREAALSELWQGIRNATAGKVQIVFITGEPGSGKTSLADEFQRQVAASKGAVRFGRGQCVEGFGSKEPFYPVLEAVGRLCRGPDGARVVDTLATEAPTWLVQFPALLTRQHRETLRQEILSATRERMLREICQALAAVATRTVLLLTLEDLHWGDSSTLDLISALARQRAPARIMLIATYRPSDLAGPAAPLEALKRDLLAHHLGREIVPQPLTEAEIAQYLADGQSLATVPNELASLLHHHTEGNPLFMTAVLEHMLGAGLVEHEPDGWRLRRSASEIAPQVPDSLREMIGAQIERLSEPEQRVLEVASIAGMTFMAAISAPTAHLDSGAFDDCCDSLARRKHVLRLAGTLELPDGQVVQRYEFVHALYREALYQRQGPARRSMLHRRRAERMEEIFAASLDDVAPELAYHFEQGADWRRAVQYLRRVASNAGRRGERERAKANLEHALALAARLPPSERVVSEIGILEVLAGIYLAMLDGAAVDTLTLLRQRAAEQCLVDVEVRALIDMGYPVSWSSSARSIEVIDEALRLSERQEDPLMRARTRARCMVRRIMARGWRVEDADECREALADIRRLGTRQDIAWDTIDSGFVELTSSGYRKAYRDDVESLGVLQEVRDEDSHGNYAAAHRLCEYVIPWSLALLGEWGAALREFDAAIGLAERNADHYGGGTLRLLRCWSQVLALDFTAARAGCVSVVPDPEQPLRTFPRHLWLTVDGAAAAGLGDNDYALQRLVAVGEEMGRQPVLLDWYWRLPQRWALASLWLSRGELERAREEGEQMAADAGATAERTWQALAWDVNARIALAVDDPRRARDLIERGLAAVEGVEAPVAAWRVHATAAEAFEALGETDSAHAHWKSSREIVLRLAASLDTYAAARRTFLTSPAVVRVLDSAAVGPGSPIPPRR